LRPPTLTPRRSATWIDMTKPSPEWVHWAAGLLASGRNRPPTSL
jgi:hypothetical protein